MRNRARRIVSLLPSATEMVVALGLGKRLVGVTHELSRSNLAGIEDSILALSRAAGVEQDALRLVAKSRARFGRLRRATAKGPSFLLTSLIRSVSPGRSPKPFAA